MKHLSPPEKAQIAQQALDALHAGQKPVEACPWPYASEEGRHWLAVWILAGGVLSNPGVL
jgi:hypothetical protein